MENVTMTDIEALADKRARLHEVLHALGSVVVAYSGGVDSTYLAAEATATLGRANALAVTAVSPSLARRDLTAARATAEAIGLAHLTVETAEVQREEYARNAPDRCFWCKTELFEVLSPLAHERDAVVTVGTNVDDLSDHRPGQRAARERGVSAPLVEASLSKAEIRTLSRSLGLDTADRPASPCLASRFAYGVRVTPEGLRRIDEAEEVVRGFGFDTCRVRDHGELARVEVPAAEIERAAAVHDELSERLRSLGYTFVTLDLTGFRSGAMNEVLEPRFRSSS